MNSGDEDIAKIARRISLGSEKSIVCDGEEISLSRRAPQRKDAEFFRKDPLVFRVQDFLYRRCYACLDADDAEPTEISKSEYVEQLAAANRSSTRWDQGWQIARITKSNWITVVKGGHTISARPGGYAAVTNRNELRVGDPVEVRAYRDSLELQPGFYFAFGETLADRGDLSATLRIYWNAPADVAPGLIEQATTIFNRYRTPLRMKCPVEPSLFRRVDSVVMYIGATQAKHALDLLSPIYKSLAEKLNPTVPIFTKPLQPGIAIAESPTAKRSFGVDRCHLVARGLVDAWRNKKNNSEGRMAAIEQAFEDSGVPIQRPYLNRIDDPFGVSRLRIC